MDLFVLIILLLAGFIIKYLIDVISSLSKEIKEIKEILSEILQNIAKKS